MFLAVQLANVHLLNPDSYADYQALLASGGLPEVRECLPTAERLSSELGTLAAEAQAGPSEREGDRQAMIVDPGLFHRALESGIKALGMGNYFEVKG